MSNICCICGRHIDGCGNNPQPVAAEGRCCDICNFYKVIPARVRLLREQHNDGGDEQCQHKLE